MSNTKLNIDMRTYPPQFSQYMHCNDVTMHGGNVYRFVDNAVVTKIVAGLRFAPPAPKLRLTGKLANAH